MTREHKLALIVGFSLVLVVGVLISDHFSQARQTKLGAAGGSVTPTSMSAKNTKNAKGTELTVVRDGLDAETVPGERKASPVTKVGLPGSRDGGPSKSAPTDITMGNRNSGKARGDVDDDGGGGKNYSEKPADSDSGAKRSTKGKLQRHEVEAGDTFSKLAGRYYNDKSLWKDLLAFNKERVKGAEGLRIGTTLLIPPRDVLLGEAVLSGDADRAEQDGTRTRESVPGTNGRPVPVIPGNSASSRTSARDRSNEPTPLTEVVKDEKAASSTYTVQAGDTLSKIASRELGSSARYKDICKLNGMSEDDELKIGMVLKLPKR